MRGVVSQPILQSFVGVKLPLKKWNCPCSCRSDFCFSWSFSHVLCLLISEVSRTHLSAVFHSLSLLSLLPALVLLQPGWCSGHFSQSCRHSEVKGDAYLLFQTFLSVVYTGRSLLDREGKPPACMFTPGCFFGAAFPRVSGVAGGGVGQTLCALQVWSSDPSFASLQRSPV